jgi:hypothetical protein
MWVLLIGFLITLWAISLLIWSLWRWSRQGDEVRRSTKGPVDKP